jgi:hypothetical protein
MTRSPHARREQPFFLRLQILLNQDNGSLGAIWLPGNFVAWNPEIAPQHLAVKAGSVIRNFREHDFLDFPLSSADTDVLANHGVTDVTKWRKYRHMDGQFTPTGSVAGVKYKPKAGEFRGIKLEFLPLDAHCWIHNGRVCELLILREKTGFDDLYMQTIMTATIALWTGALPPGTERAYSMGLTHFANHLAAVAYELKATGKRWQGLLRHYFSRGKRTTAKCRDPGMRFRLSTWPSLLCDTGRFMSIVISGRSSTTWFFGHNQAKENQNGWSGFSLLRTI